MTHPKKVWHHTDEKGWHMVTMEAVDASHAVSVDPAHWSFEKPNERVVEERIVETDGEGGGGE